VSLPVATRAPREAPSPLTAAAVALVAVVVGAWAWAVEHASYEVWGGVLVGIGLVAVSIPILQRLVRGQDDPWVGRLLVGAFTLKLGGALLRYLVAFGLYDGNADAGVYHDAAVGLSRSFRQGVFDPEVGRIVGTGFMKIATGALYAVTGPTRLGGFLVFSWLGFFGLYLFYRAFRIGVPDGDHRRYAVLVFLLPSMLFWPSSIGKEAWMTLGLGLVALGAARLLAGRPAGFRVLALGVTATALVRPHMSAVVVLGLVVAYLLRRAPSSTSALRPVLKVVGVGALLAGCVLVLSQTAHFFDVETVNPEAIERVLARTEQLTGQGGSAFEARPVRSPVELPQAAVTVVFRPFPFEARNSQTLIASIEGVALLLLFLLSWRRVVRAPLVMLQRAYVAFACTYTIGFVYAFSNIANFGIVTRQRVQLLPFVLILLALPAATDRRVAAR
jgi:hypothetical protein